MSKVIDVVEEFIIFAYREMVAAKMCIVEQKMLNSNKANHLPIYVLRYIREIDSVDHCFSRSEVMENRNLFSVLMDFIHDEYKDKLEEYHDDAAR